MAKGHLWNAIVIAADGISPNEIRNLTSSMDRRIFSLISKNGGGIKY